MRPYALLLLPAALAAAPGDDAEFFEKSVRPVFAEHCYGCHSTKVKTAFAGLRLDSRDSALKGGDAGPVIVPGKPAESRLLKALKGETAQRMPPAGALKDEQIAAIARWIESGAAWPADPVAAPSAPISAFNLEERRAQHWAWQPVRQVEPPVAGNAAWPKQPIDNFVLARLESRNLPPAAPADRRTLLRRVAFDLTGLPPSPEELEAFEGDTAPDAYEKQVDRLIASPEFAERFARRWMDLVRYSESHGSEGDPDTPETWRYRDYLIRAFRNDVPYDQLLREHFAGDLLPNPRLNAREQINESILGTALWRMVEHGFQPVDPWEDRVKWVDNQIDVLSKAFQGLTVSCARCHDHKFDAISQRDFYALFGVVAGARPTQVAIDAPEALDRNKAGLERVKAAIKNELARAWKQEARYVADRLINAAEQPAETIAETPLEAWQALRNARDFSRSWIELGEYWTKEIETRSSFNKANFTVAWDLAAGGYQSWLRHGSGAPPGASAAGEFAIEPRTDRIVRAIYPAGVYSHRLSRKHNAVIQSPRFRIDSDSISLRMLGGDLSFAQLIVENYAVPRGGIYGQRFSPRKEQMGWFTWDVTFWKGFTGYIEFATAQDATHFQLAGEEARRKPAPTPRPDGRSHFGAQRVVFHNNKLTPREEAPPILYLLEGPPLKSADDFTARVAERLEAAVNAWVAGNLTDRQAVFLDSCLAAGWLGNSASQMEALRPLAAEYRRLEDEVVVPRRAPGVLEESAPDANLLVRGNHANRGEAVPRRYLTALAGKPYEDPRLVRLRLAEDVASPANPLTARVFVNRLWKYYFRRGLVSTVDNFGKLGGEPSNPELLDYLARRFVDDGWSIQKMVRLMVTSEAYRMSSQAGKEALQADPNNELTHHIPVRRMEAEELRDAVLALSGELDRKQFGPSIEVFYAHETGATKGDRSKGPLDGKGRRSVYLEIRRNAANPFLEAFDAPKPMVTRGDRDVTNVPGQSLALLNSQFVIDQASKWGRRIADAPGTEQERIRRVFDQVLGRAPTPAELDDSVSFVAALARENSGDAARVWRDYVHAMLNLKEFLYVR